MSETINSEPQLFAFCGERLLVEEQGGNLRLPASLPSTLEQAVCYQRLLTRPGQGQWRIVELAPFDLPDGLRFFSLRRVYAGLGETLWAWAGHAVQIVHWNRDHQFCGRCGSRTVEQMDELAKRCPDCDLISYPRLSPAVIMSVTDGDRILLGRAKHFAPGRYSVLAGYVEPGETLEQAVRREVFEETGVSLAEIEYFGSQPWPFPHSLMVAFRCCYAEGQVRVNDHELEDVQWFTADAMPQLPPRMSIAHQLIDDFLARAGA
jgi:NAD+ diphosphatase